MNNSILCYIERDMFVDVEDEKILKRFSIHKNSEVKFASQLQLMSCMY